jgi:hypothetical protein
MGGSAVFIAMAEIIKERERRWHIKERSPLPPKLSASVPNATKGLWRLIKRVFTPHFGEPIP